MASANEAASFDDIIKAGRQRKQAEKLANEILGKGRRSSTPQLGAHKAGGVSTLASRITKASQRSASSSPSLHARQPQAAHAPRPTTRHPFSSSNPRSGNGPGLTIRGLAGPSVVVASNFALGTTSADIQSAFESVGGAIESCRVVSSYPTVIAEMVFADKAGAQTVIASFNNQKADGRLLHVYMKTGGPSPVVPLRSAPPAPDRASPREVFPQYHQRERERERERAPLSASGSGRGDANGRRAEPEFTDGSYGFAAPAPAAPPSEEHNGAADVNMDDDTYERDEVRLDNGGGYYSDRRGEHRPDGGDRRALGDRRAVDGDRRGGAERRDYERDGYRAPEREGRGQHRAQDAGRPAGGMESRRLYSDDMYVGQRGRGFR